jgi:hypothetical protein
VNAIGPLLALAGVVVGAVLSYAFALLGERRRERWALSREWRERRLQIYGAYVAQVERMRSIAQRIAADVGLDIEGWHIDTSWSGEPGPGKGISGSGPDPCG